MSYYTIKLNDTVSLTGSIVAEKPVIPTKPIRYSDDEVEVIWPDLPDGNIKIRFNPLNGVCSYNMIGDLEVTGNITATGVINGIGSVAYDQQTETSPTSSTATGVKGQISYAAGYMYLCVDTDSWVRWAIEQDF